MLTRRGFMVRSPFVAKRQIFGSRKWLIAELDKLTSIIVRKRDRRCVTCGKWQGLQCSHYYPRRYLAIRFSLVNCNAMCARCNRNHNTDPLPYLAYMLETYGEKVISQLEVLKGSSGRVSDEELWDMLEQYRSIA